MYSNNFGFKEEPFRLDLELKFLYKSLGHESTDRQISEQIREGKGVVVLTGETGTGKTLALLDIVSRLDSEVKFIRCASDHNSFPDLMNSLCGNLGLDINGKTIAESIHSLDDYLSEIQETHPRIALIVDDAHKVQDDVFNKLLLLSIPPSKQNASLQIILAGLPGIRRRINQVEATLRHQFKICKYRLEKLNAGDVEGYINQRLKAVGNDGDTLFTSDAVLSVAEHSDGVPRLINKICSSALFAADSEGEQIITKDLVDRIAKEWLLLSSNSDPAEANSSQNAAEPLPIPDSRNTAKYAGWGLAALVVIGVSIVSFGPGLGSLTSENPLITAAVDKPISDSKKNNAPQAKTSLDALKDAENKRPKIPGAGDESVGTNKAAGVISDQAMLLAPNAANVKKPDKIESSTDKNKSGQSTTQAAHPNAEQPGEIARQFIRNRENSGEPINLDKFYDKGEILSKQGQSMNAYLLYFYAAKRGHGNAAFRLAQIADPATFKPGLSITGEPNLVQAKKWYKRAALAGHPNAKRSMKEFRTQIAAQADQGDDRAREMMILLQ